MPDWISVKDRLPEPDTICLVATKARAGASPIVVGRYRILGQSSLVCWLSVPGDWSIAVTHWMELPPAPTET